MLLDAATYDRAVALVEEGIYEGARHPDHHAEAVDGSRAQVQLEEGRLLAAARSVSSLLEGHEWDELQDILIEAGAPSDVFAWDREEVVTRRT